MFVLGLRLALSGFTAYGVVGVSKITVVDVFLHRLVRCGIEVVWFCLRMRIFCLWSLLSFVTHFLVMRFTGSCHSWCMAAMGTLVTFLLYSAVVFYVVVIADSLHWVLATVHRYTASWDSGSLLRLFPIPWAIGIQDTCKTNRTSVVTSARVVQSQGSITEGWLIFSGAVLTMSIL